ncbi:hypothetical protein [Cerasicoccus frondis]|uniref:hypothetical protein n=1 Tax=Cerasicoccus frondis TaxID=490090 RepID=UPI0028524A39|nr:hypothetical protein [Cerasicoccus frondis]
MVKDLGINFEQLKTAVDWSVSQLDKPRRNRVEAIREYVGMHYAENGSEKRVPTNFLELAVTIYTRQLIARSPRVMVSAANRQLRPQARSMQVALNQVPKEIGLDATLRRAVVEAMFSFAVVKVGIASSGTAILGHDHGEPYVDLVSIDDYFCDMTAKSPGAIQFEGNDYWLPVDEVEGIFGKKLEHDSFTVQGSEGEPRAEGISSDEGADLYKEKVWLRDVWIPSTGQLVTYTVKTGKLLRVIDWDGPECGPYITLGFSEVPGNLLPLPPVALWRDLHELGNSLFRKLGRQADSKKSVAAFQGGNDDDVNALKRADDGDGIRYNGQKPEQIQVGGIDAPTLAFYLQVRDLFNYFGGNLDSLGGLAASSETVGQDRLLSEASGARLSFMKEQVIDFVKKIFEALAWYEWTDPVRERIIEKDVPGTSIKVVSKWSADTREGDFVQYNFDIDVHSMQDDSPTTKLRKVAEALQNYILPLMPYIQQQGGQINMQSLVEMVSRLGNIPELDDIVVFQNVTTGDPVQGNPQPQVSPAQTKRTYERISRSGATRHGKDDVMSRLLMGGNVQKAEGATIGSI